MKGHGALLSDDGPTESYSGLEVRFADITTGLPERRFWLTSAPTTRELGIQSREM
jgi:hypothetical protein